MKRLALAGLVVLTGCTLELPQWTFEASPDSYKCSKGSARIEIKEPVLKGLNPPTNQESSPAESVDFETVRKFMADCEAFLSPFASVPRAE